MRSMRDFRSQNRQVDRAIKSRTVLLIGSDGKNLGVTDTREAYRIAESEGLDLVQVGEGKNGLPVCRVMDHGKVKYEQSKKRKAAKAVQQLTKELKIRPNTTDHDLQYRASKASEFLAAGDKVKVVVRFRGRERNHMADTGRDSLERFLSMMDASKYKAEKPVEMGEREISITLIPAKT
jgi:translation initiation factor IF-3